MFRKMVGRRRVARVGGLPYSDSVALRWVTRSLPQQDFRLNATNRKESRKWASIIVLIAIVPINYYWMRDVRRIFEIIADTRS